MGKIMEKENELIELKKELENLEIERMSGITSFDFMPVSSEDVHDINESPNVPETSVISEISEIPEITPSPEPEIQHNRKIINIDKILVLAESDHIRASDISTGKYTFVKWGSRNYVPAWCNGRKYDPTNGRISNLRAELRRASRSIRGLSSITGLAIDSVKDLVREMDKQGFFVN
jgi:hypothetical protein